MTRLEKRRLDQDQAPKRATIKPKRDSTAKNQHE